MCQAICAQAQNGKTSVSSLASSKRGYSILLSLHLLMRNWVLDMCWQSRQWILFNLLKYMSPSKRL